MRHLASRTIPMLAIVGVALSVLAGSALAAEASPSASVPSGSALFIRDQVGQLYRVDSTGALVAIGAPQPSTPGIQDSLQGTYDPITNASYVVELDSSFRKDIVKVDTATGAPVSRVQSAQLFSGIAAAADGTIYGMGNFSKDFKLQTVNLDSGALTDVPGAPRLSGYVLNAQAIHPSNGMLYAFKEDFNQSPSLWSLASINTATGQASPTLIDIDETTLGSGFFPRSMAIDTNGVFWVLAEGEVVGGFTSMKLYSFVINNNLGQATIVSSYAPPFFSSSLWLAPFGASAPGPAPSPSDGETLANTGADTTGAIAAALLLVALGSVLWLGRRRGMAGH